MKAKHKYFSLIYSVSEIFQNFLLTYAKEHLMQHIFDNWNQKFQFNM